MYTDPKTIAVVCSIILIFVLAIFVPAVVKHYREKESHPVDELLENLFDRENSVTP